MRLFWLNKFGSDNVSIYELGWDSPGRRQRKRGMKTLQFIDTMEDEEIFFFLNLSNSTA